MTQAKSPQRAPLQHWTLDQALWWMHEGRELEVSVCAGPHRYPENIGRLLEAFKRGGIVASGVTTGSRQDLRPVEWMDLEIVCDDSGLGFSDEMFADDFCDDPLIVRSARVFPRIEVRGCAMAAGRVISGPTGAVEGFHTVIEDVLLPAEQVRAAFPSRLASVPLPARSTASRKGAIQVAEKELLRIIGGSPALRLLSNDVLKEYVTALAVDKGFHLSDEDFRELKKKVVETCKANAWVSPGAPKSENEPKIRQTLNDLGLSHLRAEVGFPSE